MSKYKILSKYSTNSRLSSHSLKKCKKRNEIKKPKNEMSCIENYQTMTRQIKGEKFSFGTISSLKEVVCCKREKKCIWITFWERNTTFLEINFTILMLNQGLSRHFKKSLKLKAMLNVITLCRHRFLFQLTKPPPNPTDLAKTPRWLNRNLSFAWTFNRLNIL